MEDTGEEIKINEFLKFLKIACHVNDLIRDSKESNSNSIDFDELASNKIIQDLYGFSKGENIENIDVLPAAMDAAPERKRLPNNYSIKKVNSGPYSGESVEKKPIHPKLNEKLDYLINEGVLDSVLPFVCPIVPTNKQCQGMQKNNLKVKARDISPPSTSRLKSVPSIYGDCQESINLDEAKELPVSTTVVEDNIISSGITTKDTRPTSRRRSIATPRMNLSAENKKQDTEVVIHVCDEIKNTSRDFTCPQKLLVSKMGYFADVTAGQKLEDMDISVHCDIQIFEWLMKWIKKKPDQQDLPVLDATNVVPILVSASFLQMEPLLLDCLSFCHARLTDVVRSSTNLSCLNDSIITRLAAMFTNLELEVVKDKKERVTPRLWTKLIQSLCEQEPQALRGHYFSLAGLFRCSKCGKCLTQTMSSYIGCLPSNVRLNRWGQLVSQHTRDVSWDLSHYITSLFKELKSWRRVYWKLWGHCHFLYCCICETHFPIYQGCQFREHSVVLENDRDRAIFNLLQIASEGDSLFENPPSKLREEVSSSTMEPRWIGLCLMPTKCRPGLLPILSPEEYYNKLSRKLRLGASHFAESSSESDTSDTPEKSKKFPLRNFSTSSDGCESETSSLKRVHRRRNRRQTEFSGRFWSGELSARSNQDHQREFEEKVMKHVTTAVGKKTGVDSNTAQNSASNSGKYVRLEAEWREQVKQKNAFKQKFK